MSCADWGKSVIGVVKKTELPEPGPHCPFRRLVPHERQEDARVPAYSATTIAEASSTFAKFSSPSSMNCGC